jgi:putative oxidoreductase
MPPTVFAAGVFAMTTTYAGPPAAYSTTSPLGDSFLLIGRIALVVLFFMSGISKFADIQGTAADVASKGLPAATVLAVLAGLAEVVGGALIVVGWQTRIVALGLLVYTLIAAYFFHDFWHMPEGAERLDALVHALKNLSIAGAFLMLAGSGAGRYSIDGPCIVHENNA